MSSTLEALRRRNQTGYQPNKGEFFSQGGLSPARASQNNADGKILLEEDDTLNRTIEILKDVVEKRINNSPDFQALLSKNSWSFEDREQWERSLSQLVSDEMDKIPGLDNYRDIGSVHGTYINELSDDIEKGLRGDRSYTKPFVCHQMTLIEAEIIQGVEDNILPQGNGYKSATSYHTAVGNVILTGQAALHAWVMSEATGNIIEATTRNGRNPYTRSADPNYSLDDFKANRPFVAAGEPSAYGTRNLSFQELAKLAGTAPPRPEPPLLRAPELDTLQIVRANINTPLAQLKQQPTAPQPLNHGYQRQTPQNYGHETHSPSPAQPQYQGTERLMIRGFNPEQVDIVTQAVHQIVHDLPPGEKIMLQPSDLQHGSELPIIRIPSHAIIERNLHNIADGIRNRVHRIDAGHHSSLDSEKPEQDALAAFRGDDVITAGDRGLLSEAGIKINDINPAEIAAAQPEMSMQTPGV
ncbi:MAG: hypothetical protein ACLFP8_05885 [Alphaproteobacteria bacterium]